MDILLVDDSRTMRIIIQRAIRQAGYRGLAVEEADSAQQAIEKVRSSKPKLILSDWNMPEKSGLDFLRQLRDEKNNVPFGFVTSEASAEMRALATNSGASFFITKPFTPEDFQSALLPVLG